jgi:hypothetical protein
MLRTGSILAASACCLLLAACGEEKPAPPASQAPAAASYRIVDAKDANASCEANEVLVSAYCYEDAGDGVSASGPAIRADAGGKLTVSCLTGGPNLRLFCATKP